MASARASIAGAGNRNANDLTDYYAIEELLTLRRARDSRSARRFVHEAVREMVPYHRASKFPDPTARMGSLGSCAPYLKDHAAWA